MVGITKGKEPNFERLGFSFFNSPFIGNSSENMKRMVKPVIDNRGKYKLLRYFIVRKIGGKKL